jgi:hypothetical protein
MKSLENKSKQNNHAVCRFGSGLTTEIPVGYWFFLAVKACFQCLGLKKKIKSKTFPSKCK